MLPQGGEGDNGKQGSMSGMIGAFYAVRHGSQTATILMISSLTLNIKPQQEIVDTYLFLLTWNSFRVPLIICVCWTYLAE